MMIMAVTERTIKNIEMCIRDSYNTASVILQNTKMVKDFTAAVTGTNVAYEPIRQDSG